MKGEEKQAEKWIEKNTQKTGHWRKQKDLKLKKRLKIEEREKNIKQAENRIKTKKNIKENKNAEILKKDWKLKIKKAGWKWNKKWTLKKTKRLKI